MMKANWKKMILAAAMAAFMVYAPAMAEEADEIIEEPFETVETITEESEAAPAIMIEVVGLEAIAEEEVSEQAAQAAAAAETGANAEVQAAETETQAARTFTFENEEVIVKAEAVAELPENVEMQVRKLEKGSAEYEAAKQAVEANCGAADSAEYNFYDVTFTADGQEVELAAGSVYVQVAFKTVQVDSEAELQEIFHLSENGVDNVTAQTEEGSNMSSVNFAM